MCLYPKLIKNRKYMKTKKNGGVIPPITDERVKYVPVGCGNCMECRNKKAREWNVRLHEEIKESKNGKFITLTFSNESIKKIISEQELTSTGYELDNELATKAVRLFLERWRKKFKKSVKHWLITEIGHNGTENIHLHGIIWTEESMKTIAEIWNYGFVWPKPDSKEPNFVNGKTINYITKYVHKVDKDHEGYKSKVLCSPGIGGNYKENLNSKLNTFNGENTRDTYKMNSGHEVSMPIYFRNKVYTEQEREKLWLHKLDKGERWIMGNKVKADDEKSIYALLAYYREKNKKLGYGSDEKNWDREEYEQNRRKILLAKRIETLDGKSKYILNTRKKK